MYKLKFGKNAIFSAYSKENWQKGVYFLPKAWKTGIVAIHQLPVNRGLSTQKLEDLSEA